MKLKYKLFFISLILLVIGRGFVIDIKDKVKKKVGKNESRK
jgi:hypothetical protein